jgi:hypothetical protein
MSFSIDALMPENQVGYWGEFESRFTASSTLSFLGFSTLSGKIFVKFHSSSFSVIVAMVPSP